MDYETPWASCVTTMTLILYLERIGKETDIEYQEILSGVGDLDKIEDPKAFLKDYNNWVPIHVLRKLCQMAERVTGNKEVTYLAARDYCLPHQAPPILEVIVKLSNNIEQIMFCSNLWAGGYTNYLQSQCLKPSVSDGSELIYLSRFGLNAEPWLSSIQLLRGVFEGFTKLFDYIEDVSCIEEISQVKIETVIKEFGNYYVERDRDKLSVFDSSSKKELVTARRVYLRYDVITLAHEYPTSSEDLVVYPKNGKVTILSLQKETNPDNKKDENAVYEIVQGGTLHSGPVKYTFQSGRFFNAPYSRYRYKWKMKGVPEESPERALMKSEFIPLLFNHLRGLRETQRWQLLSTIKKEALALANVNLKTTIQKEFDFFGMIGKAPRMQELFEQIQTVARVDSTVLIMGETGTGKELLARAIHQASLRFDQKFLAINCAALPESLLEAELFGYEKGAFTGALSQKKGILETVNGGTLFLDEVGEIPSSMQVKLLRVLEEQEIQRVGGREIIHIDVRIISATNEDLKDLVTSGRFRSDLYYRLYVITFEIPPLRERLEDLVLLVDHYLDFFSRKCKKQKPVITREAITVLTNYKWPGNIRELKNVIERAVVMDQDQQITIDDIIIEEEDQSLTKTKIVKPHSFHDSIESYKRHVIEDALKKSNGNQSKAAQLLGLQRTYLARLIKQLNIS
jgi:two-component system, NtrC family, response regulator AtoC